MIHDKSCHRVVEILDNRCGVWKLIQKKTKYEKKKEPEKKSTNTHLLTSKTLFSMIKISVLQITRCLKHHYKLLFPYTFLGIRCGSSRQDAGLAGCLLPADTIVLVLSAPPADTEESSVPSGFVSEKRTYCFEPLGRKMGSVIFHKEFCPASSSSAVPGGWMQRDLS